MILVYDHNPKGIQQSINFKIIVETCVVMLLKIDPVVGFISVPEVEESAGMQFVTVGRVGGQFSAQIPLLLSTLDDTATGE